jgi:hypothetical protein
VHCEAAIELVGGETGREQHEGITASRVSERGVREKASTEGELTHKANGRVHLSALGVVSGCTSGVTVCVG